VLPAPLTVRLAEDSAAARTKLEAAVRAAGTDRAEVRGWGPGAVLLRNFLPAEDGGAGDGMGLRHYNRGLVPWEEFPPQLSAFGQRVGGEDNPLFHRLRVLYATPFARSVLEGGHARDLMLRGSFHKAATDLARENEQLRTAAAHKQSSPQLAQAVEKWLEAAVQVYAEKSRADARGTSEQKELANRQIDDLWRSNSALGVLLGGSLAGPHGAEVTYLLGLCKHEQAERAQARLERAGKEAAREDAERVRVAWEDAEGWWREYGAGHAGRAGAVAARRLRAEALSRLGRRDEAIALLRGEPTGPPRAPLEKLADLYSARRLEAP
jgi:hypothetical protein